MPIRAHAALPVALAACLASGACVPSGPTASLGERLGFRRSCQAVLDEATRLSREAVAIEGGIPREATAAPPGESALAWPMIALQPDADPAMRNLAGSMARVRDEAFDRDCPIRFAVPDTIAVPPRAAPRKDAGGQGR